MDDKDFCFSQSKWYSSLFLYWFNFTMLQSCKLIIGSASMIHLKWVSAYPSFRSIKVGNKFQWIVSPMFIYWTFKTIYTTAVLASTTLSGNEFQWSTTLWKTVFPPICSTVFFFKYFMLMTSSICFSDWKYVGTVYLVDIVDDFVRFN